MFSYLKGILTEKKSNYAVIECGGVGFKVYTSFTSLCDPDCVQGSQVKFYTYMYIKEGIMDLYGFSTNEELEMFELLISVSGVGAKGALAILSTLTPAKLSLVIASGDCQNIKKAPGIGAKTAQRIVLELKDKVKTDAFVTSGSDLFAEDIPNASNERDEAVNALISLGYSGAEAKNAVSKVKANINEVEEIIKLALKSLM